MPGLVDQCFNDSTGEGQDGQIDARGPGIKVRSGNSSRLQRSRCRRARWERRGGRECRRSIDEHRERTREIEELLVDELRDLLSAEGQLLKALPKMTKGANAGRLKVAFENHLEETNAQVERLKECCMLLGAQVRAKPCKGMAGLIEEGQAVIAAGKEQDRVATDLALMASTQKVEHYEISGGGDRRQPLDADRS